MPIKDDLTTDSSDNQHGVNNECGGFQDEVNSLARSLITPKNTGLQSERDDPLALPRPKIIKLLKALCALRGIVGSPNLTWHRRSLLRRLYRETIR